MKTIRFTYHHGRYHCSEPGDQDGEYVPAATSAGLVAALEAALPLVALAATGACGNSKDAAEIVFRKVKAALASARGKEGER